MNKVFFIPISYSSEVFSNLLPSLTAQERAYISKYKLFNNSYESLIARVAIKKTCGIDEIAIGNNGQPYIANSSLHISIAHCEGAVLIGISEQVIGVDLEPTQNLLDAHHFLHPKETNFSSDDFLTIWTIKEAFVKSNFGGFLLMDPTNIHCFKKDNKWRISGYLNSIKVQKIDIFNVAIVTLNLPDIEIVVLNEIFLMTFNKTSVEKT